MVQEQVRESSDRKHSELARRALCTEVTVRQTIKIRCESRAVKGEATMEDERRGALFAGGSRRGEERFCSIPAEEQEIPDRQRRRADDQ